MFPSTRLRINSEAGFTLVELIAVLMIAGILAVVAVPRFFDRNTFDTRSFADEVQAMVRYAQKVAVAQNRKVFVVFTGSSGALCFDAACSQHVRAPVARKITTACNDAAWMCMALPVNVGITPAAQVFYFNALGRPFNLNDVDPASSFSGLTITVSGGGVNRAIVVERETGYVHS